MRPKRPSKWISLDAKKESTCWICKQKIYPGSKVTKYGHRWPHLSCARQHDADICAP